MPFWVTWFLIGAFTTTAAAYSIHNSSSVAALITPPSVEQQLGEDSGNRSN